MPEVEVSLKLVDNAWKEFMRQRVGGQHDYSLWDFEVWIRDTYKVNYNVASPGKRERAVAEEGEHLVAFLLRFG